MNTFLPSERNYTAVLGLISISQFVAIQIVSVLQGTAGNRRARPQPAAGVFDL